MPVSIAANAVDVALYNAAARATFAPSLHNTQPWRFITRPGHLDLYADPSRQARTIDPTGRQLAISCGAALFGARLALAAGDMDAVTVVLPDLTRPHLLATISVETGDVDPNGDAVRLNAVVESRHSNRRQFDATPLDEASVNVLVRAAETEGAWLRAVEGDDDRVALAVLSQRADALQQTNPAYRAEMLAWTTDDPSRDDGVPTALVPHTTGESHDDVPLRDFDARGTGGLPSETRSRMTQTLLVLGTNGDALSDWLKAGQALARVLLELTSAGFVASIMSQVVEEPSTRQQLRNELRFTGHPQLILRVGTAERTPSSARRPLSEVISAAVPR
jgi:hypothetical protein